MTERIDASTNVQRLEKNKEDLSTLEIFQLESERPNYLQEGYALIDFLKKFKVIGKNQNPEYGWYQVAKLQDKVIGFLRSIAVDKLYAPDTPTLQTVHVIKDIMVDPEFQRRGVGEKLVKNLEKLFTDAEYSLDNLVVESLTASLKFWKKVGYEPISEKSAILKKVAKTTK
ncbi:MAG: GNAT family N-acetyltransferase [Patescibacteria group bacterium]|nr:GNAT family N-acetyltransferase [Patescibacteria group bacterium]MDD4610387.1 GNAT family N-acetyltransferase [Patescibacteria group bacterium]